MPKSIFIAKAIGKALNEIDITQKLRDFSNSDLDSSPQWKSFYNLGMNFPSWISGWIAGLPTKFPKLWQKYRGGAVLISSPAKYGVDGIVAVQSFTLS